MLRAFRRLPWPAPNPTWLEHVVVVDVMIIAIGFVLYVPGGSAVGVDVPNWLLLSTIFVALLLAFSERRHEFTELPASVLGKTIL